eukprot:13983794-Alexandrium_andersonii.AAC.1
MPEEVTPRRMAIPNTRVGELGLRGERSDQAAPDLVYFVGEAVRTRGLGPVLSTTAAVALGG